MTQLREMDDVELGEGVVDVVKAVEAVKAVAPAEIVNIEESTEDDLDDEDTDDADEDIEDKCMGSYEIVDGIVIEDGVHQIDVKSTEATDGNEEAGREFAYGIEVDPMEYQNYANGDSQQVPLDEVTNVHNHRLSSEETFAVKAECDIERTDGPCEFFMVNTIEEMRELVNDYSERTSSHFVAWCKTKHFGVTSQECDLSNNRIQWHDDRSVNNFIQYDGVPHVTIGHYELHCQFGVDKSAAQKERRRKKKEHGEIVVKSRNLSTPTKKCGCPAKIVVKHIIRFPEYHIDRDTKWKRNEASSKLKAKLKENRSDVLTEPIILGRLPDITEHKYHENLHGKEFSKEVVSRELAIKAQEYFLQNKNNTEILENLREYVVNEMFWNQEPPDYKRRKFFPTRKDIRNFNARVRHLSRFSDEELESIRKIIDLCQQKDPNGNISFQIEEKSMHEGENRQDSSDDETHHDCEKVTKRREERKVHSYVCVHQSSQQQRLLKKYSAIAYIIEIHSQTTPKRILTYRMYAVVVQTNVDFQVCGVVIVSKQRKDALVEGLTLFREWNSTWSPKYLLVDFSDVVLDAILRVFPEATFFLNPTSCENKWCEFVNTPSNNVLASSEEVLTYLKNMQYSLNEESLSIAAALLERSEIWQNGEKLRNWFQKTWLHLAKKWVFGYRAEDLLIMQHLKLSINDSVLVYKDALYQSAKLNGFVELLEGLILTTCFSEYEKYVKRNNDHYRCYTQYRKSNGVSDAMLGVPLSIMPYIDGICKQAEKSNFSIIQNQFGSFTVQHQGSVENNNAISGTENSIDQLLMGDHSELSTQSERPANESQESADAPTTSHIATQFVLSHVDGTPQLLLAPADSGSQFVVSQDGKTQLVTMLAQADQDLLQSDQVPTSLITQNVAVHNENVSSEGSYTPACPEVVAAGSNSVAQVLLPPSSNTTQFVISQADGSSQLVISHEDLNNFIQAESKLITSPTIEVSDASAAKGAEPGVQKDGTGDQNGAPSTKPTEPVLNELVSPVEPEVAMTETDFGWVEYSNKICDGAYTVFFGDSQNYPSCTCSHWLLYRLPCLHMLAVFCKVPGWRYDMLSSTYRLNPVLEIDYSCISYPINPPQMDRSVQTVTPSTMAYKTQTHISSDDSIFEAVTNVKGHAMTQLLGQARSFLQYTNKVPFLFRDKILHQRLSIQLSRFVDTLDAKIRKKDKNKGLFSEISQTIQTMLPKDNVARDKPLKISTLNMEQISNSRGGNSTCSSAGTSPVSTANDNLPKMIPMGSKDNLTVSMIELPRNQNLETVLQALQRNNPSLKVISAQRVIKPIDTKSFKQQQRKAEKDWSDLSESPVCLPARNMRRNRLRTCLSSDQSVVFRIPTLHAKNKHRTRVEFDINLPLPMHTEEYLNLMNTDGDHTNLTFTPCAITDSQNRKITPQSIIDSVTTQKNVPSNNNMNNLLVDVSSNPATNQFPGANTLFLAPQQVDLPAPTSPNSTTIDINTLASLLKSGQYSISDTSTTLSSPSTIPQVPDSSNIYIDLPKLAPISNNVFLNLTDETTSLSNSVSNGTLLTGNVTPSNIMEPITGFIKPIGFTSDTDPLSNNQLNVTGLNSVIENCDAQVISQSCGEPSLSISGRHVSNPTSQKRTLVDASLPLSLDPSPCKTIKIDASVLQSLSVVDSDLCNLQIEFLPDKPNMNKIVQA